MKRAPDGRIIVKCIDCNSGIFEEWSDLPQYEAEHICWNSLIRGRKTSGDGMSIPEWCPLPGAEDTDDAMQADLDGLIGITGGNDEEEDDE